MLFEVKATFEDPAAVQASVFELWVKLLSVLE
jgi:hypothetical protein